jgi:hypothetical protein
MRFRTTLGKPAYQDWGKKRCTAGLNKTKHTVCQTVKSKSNGKLNLKTTTQSGEKLSSASS